MKRPPVGVIIIGLILIVTSLDQLRHIPAFDNYRQINPGYSDGVLAVRYAISYLLRIIGLCGGIGIFLLKEHFRRLLLGLAWFSVSTLWLRHTYSAQFYYSEPLYYQHGSMFSLEVFTWIAVIVRWLIDGIFAGVLIYYLTRPKVREHFAGATSVSDKKDG